METQEIYRVPLTVKAAELTELKKNLVKIKMGEMILEGTIGTIYLASNDSTEFGSFDFTPTEETKANYSDVELPTNLTAFEIQGIKGK